MNDMHFWPLGQRKRVAEKRPSFFERMRARAREKVRAKAHDANAMARLIEEEQAEYESRYAETGAEVYLDFARKNEAARVQLNQDRGKYASTLGISFEAVCAL